MYIYEGEDVRERLRMLKKKPHFLFQLNQIRDFTYYAVISYLYITDEPSFLCLLPGLGCKNAQSVFCRIDGIQAMKIVTEVKIDFAVFSPLRRSLSTNLFRAN